MESHDQLDKMAAYVESAQPSIGIFNDFHSFDNFYISHLDVPLTVKNAMTDSSKKFEPGLAVKTRGRPKRRQYLRNNVATWRHASSNSSSFMTDYSGYTVKLWPNPGTWPKAKFIPWFCHSI